MAGPLGRAGVRRLLRSLIRTDEDLDALCLDYFPEVASRLARGMDRLAKVNLLIDLTPPSKIVAQLRERFSDDPSALVTIDHVLTEPQTEQERESRAQWDKIEQLHLKREQLLQTGQSTVEVDRELVAIKRVQRHDAPISEGQLLKERYRLIQCIGRGGFAQVWHAFDRLDRRSVAVKILRGELNEEPRRLERFVRGARLMKGLAHPSIVRVLDGPDESDGFHYFVMDYLPGGDLYQAVSNGKIDPAICLDAVLSVGSALEYAHQRGLVHRDVKPQNIVLNEHGAAFLSDFDLVWAAHTTGGTQSGFLGTHVYVAPEQAEDAKAVDRRADVYSLGMTTLFVLHGGSLPQKAVYQRALFIDQLHCPEALKSLLHKATAIDPAERPATAQEFCQRFAEAMPVDFKENPPRPSRSALRPVPVEPDPELKPAEDPAEPGVPMPSSSSQGIGTNLSMSQILMRVAAAGLVSLLSLLVVFLLFRSSSSAPADRSPVEGSDPKDTSARDDARAQPLPSPKAEPLAPVAKVPGTEIPPSADAPFKKGPQVLQVQFAFTDAAGVQLSCGGKPQGPLDCSSSGLCKKIALVAIGQECTVKKEKQKKTYSYRELKMTPPDRKGLIHILVLLR